MAFSAALEQIIRLQPNFINVWRFQAWNLSYNISVEFDDFHDRYYWVMKGINFIIGGTTVQQERTATCSTTWAGSSPRKSAAPTNSCNTANCSRKTTILQRQSASRAERDNWLVGREWYLKAQEVVDKLGVPIKGITPLVFHSYPVDGADRLHRGDRGGRNVRRGGQERLAQVPKSWQRVRRPRSAHDLQRFDPSERLRAHRRKSARRGTAALDDAVARACATSSSRRTNRQASSRKIAKSGKCPPTNGTRSAQRALRASKPESNRLYVELPKAPIRKRDSKRCAWPTPRPTKSGWPESSIAIATSSISITGGCTANWSKPPTPWLLAKRPTTGTRPIAPRICRLAQKQYDEGLAKWRAVLDAFPHLIKESVVVDELMDVVDEYTRCSTSSTSRIPQRVRPAGRGQ